MKITVLASTTLWPAALEVLPRSSDDVTDPDHLAELAGRRCYRSEHRPNPATAANADYLANIVRQGHESVLAHASVAFLVENVSRSLTHELIRSVFLGYSQESQRYVVPPIDLLPVLPPDADECQIAQLTEDFEVAIDRYHDAYARARANGLTKKEAAGLARAWLPQATPTSLVVSGNLRAWRDFLQQRATKDAEVEIRGLAIALHTWLRVIAPNTFADIPILETAP